MLIHRTNTLKRISGRMSLKQKGLIFIFIYVLTIASFYNVALAVSLKDYDEAVSTGKKVRIEGASQGDGKTLDALVYVPSGSGPHPALVALHGAGGIFPYQLWWARELSKKGFVVLFIDHYCTRGYLCEHATDDSDSKRGAIMRDWQQVSPRQRVADAAAGYNWLSNKNYINKSKIGLIGWSWGGSAALFVHKISGRLSLPNGGFKATIAFYPNLQYLIDKPEWIRTGPIKQPVLILYGKNDVIESDESYDVLKSSDFPAPIKVLGFEGAYRKFDELGHYREKFHPSIGKFPKAFQKTSFERSILEVNKFLSKYMSQTFSETSTN